MGARFGCEVRLQVDLNGTSAGKASHIAMTALSDTLLVTAVRNDSGNLLLISWRLETGNTLSRLTPEGTAAGNYL